MNHTDALRTQTIAKILNTFGAGEQYSLHDNVGINLTDDSYVTIHSEYTASTGQKYHYVIDIRVAVSRSSVS